MNVASRNYGKMRNAYTIFAGKPERKTPLERTTHTSFALTFILYKECLKWTEVTQCMYQWHAKTKLRLT
jgi:hypothetical protein